MRHIKTNPCDVLLTFPVARAQTRARPAMPYLSQGAPSRVFGIVVPLRRDQAARQVQRLLNLRQLQASIRDLKARGKLCPKYAAADSWTQE